MDRSSPGRRAWSFAALDVPEAAAPPEHGRTTPPRLPQVAEIDLVRHYTMLSQQNYGSTPARPLGSCTMKYNPKVAETVAAFLASSALTRCSPTTRCRALELLWRLERALCEITGMSRATLQPRRGAAAR